MNNPIEKLNSYKILMKGSKLRSFNLDHKLKICYFSMFNSKGEPSHSGYFEGDDYQYIFDKLTDLFKDICTKEDGK